MNFFDMISDAEDKTFGDIVKKALKKNGYVRRKCCSNIESA